MDQHTVTIYSQPGCPQCKMVKMMLNKNNIQYIENQDTEQIKALGFSHTPVLVVDEKSYVGKDIFEWVRLQGGNGNGNK